VDGGIVARSRSGAIGKAWWSQRFIQVLERMGISSRLQRGRSYARRGQVLAMKVEPGLVTARVQGSRARPYEVRVSVPLISSKDWNRAEQAMARHAIFVAKLLAGEMPQQIEEAFRECRLALFPESPRELSDDCTCPDWESPCKHVAATFYLLAEAFDDDPFLVFLWRGRRREALIESVRSLREMKEQPEEDPRSLAAASGRADEPADVGDPARAWDPRGPLPPRRQLGNPVGDALLVQLGPAPVGYERFRQALPELYRAASDAAQQMLDQLAEDRVDA
jgi:uncharacterized Zn finger protein